MEAESFKVEGILRVHQSELKEDPQQQCLCCRPRGHVFGFGIDLPSERAVARPVGATARPDDWLQRVLYPHRFESGRRVRLTLELLPLDESEEASC